MRWRLVRYNPGCQCLFDETDDCAIVSDSESPILRGCILMRDEDFSEALESSLLYEEALAMLKSIHGRLNSDPMYKIVLGNRLEIIVIQVIIF